PCVSDRLRGRLAERRDLHIDLVEIRQGEQLFPQLLASRPKDDDGAAAKVRRRSYQRRVTRSNALFGLSTARTHFDLGPVPAAQSTPARDPSQGSERPWPRPFQAIGARRQCRT